jgi:hypothetical protein
VGGEASARREVDEARQEALGKRPEAFDAWGSAPLPILFLEEVDGLMV